MDYESGDHYTTDWSCMAAVSRVRVRGHGLWPRLNVSPCLSVAAVGM